jgi:hypothetical protein
MNISVLNQFIYAAIWLQVDVSLLITYYDELNKILHSRSPTFTYGSTFSKNGLVPRAAL